MSLSHKHKPQQQQLEEMEARSLRKHLELKMDG